MGSPLPFLGETLALLSAAFWAVAVIFYKLSGETIHPLALSLFKNLLALFLFLPTMWIFGETLLRSVPTNSYLLLLLSGAIGMAIGDTLFFVSLSLIGAGLTAIVVCMYSPFIITLSVIWLGESLSKIQILGAILIIGAVLLASLQLKKEKIVVRKLLLGILCGVLASLATAIGIVMIKPLLEQSPLLWVTEVRLIGGIVALAIIFLLLPARKDIIKSLVTTQNWLYPSAGAVIGTYIALVAWLGGMKYTQASIASVLNQTSTIFIFLFAGIILKEPMNLRRAIGIALAFIGVLLVSFGG